MAIDIRWINGSDLKDTADLVPQLNHSGIPTQSFQDMVARGESGTNSGTGFYEWGVINVETRKKQAMEKLQRIIHMLAEKQNCNGNH